MTFWLFMAVWVSDPKDYKLVAKLGPFDSAQQCWSMGALVADNIQGKDSVSNALGACMTGDSTPTLMDMKSMWGMYCASQNKDDLCWLKHTYLPG